MKPSNEAVRNVRQESVLAVLVLYEKEIEKTESFRTLVNQLSDSLNDRLVLRHILIYDNSEKNYNSNFKNIKSNITYFHNPCNGGTVAAYSHALELANVFEINWILLLDHDTKIPFNHLVLAANELTNIEDENIAALVPRVKHGDKIISPALLNKYGSVVPNEDLKNKKNSDFITAISSGVLINTIAFKNIMPFPSDLWLDYVDHWIFLMFNRSKWKILNFDSIINHHLSVEMPSELSVHRLLSILNGEALLISLLGAQAKKIYYIRIFFRMIKYYRLNPKLVRPMIRWFIFQIINKSK